jgi:hypothetical protein
VRRQVVVAKAMREAGVQIERHTAELTTRDQNDADVGRSRTSP